MIHPLPKNMYTAHHKRRHEARTKALGRTYGSLQEMVYTDAAAYRGRRAKAVVVTIKMGLLVNATMPDATTQEAEELAVALALTQTTATAIITDSQEGCRSFTSGWVARTTQCTLTANCKLPERNVEVVWTPAYAFLEGNERAQSKARELIDQAPEGTEELTRQTTYLEIPQHYRLNHRKHPPPHPQLIKTQGTTLRLWQTNTFPQPKRLHLILATQYDEQCRYCEQL
ncbi:hypothetical protein HPB49_004262 [Dermacentor silvarum]|uniref:Uncharacterized protein n=1 Tax=Dermacentor silvarum TaxID=543639 RepID=A0ACB8CV33_DERSI|nr:hypothetical protein HPB49_004262 [Dermacentor silvarum]